MASHGLRARLREFAENPATTYAQLLEVARLADAVSGRGPSGNWSPLPAELWCEALSFLGPAELLVSASRVCRGLRDLAADPRSWRVFVLPPALRLRPDPLRLVLLRDNLSLLRRMSVEGWRAEVPPALFSHVLPATLTELDLSGTLLLDHSLLLLAESPAHRSLRVLRLAGCTELTDVGLMYVARLPELRDLDLSSCDVSVGLDTVAERCPHLARLVLADCADVDDAAVCDVARRSGGLRELVLRSCPDVGEAACEALARGCPLLRSLEVDGLTDAGAACIGAGLGELAFLRVAASASLTDEGVASVVRGCRELSDLRLLWCSLVGDASCAAVAEHCTALRTLHMASCVRVTDRGLAALAGGAGVRRTLTDVNMNRCARLSNTGVAAAASSLDALRTLSLVGCHRFNRHGLAMVPPRVAVTSEASAGVGGAAEDGDAASARRKRRGGAVIESGRLEQLEI